MMMLMIKVSHQQNDYDNNRISHIKIVRQEWMSAMTTINCFGPFVMVDKWQYWGFVLCDGRVRWGFAIVLSFIVNLSITHLLMMMMMAKLNLYHLKRVKVTFIKKETIEIVK